MQSHQITLPLYVIGHRNPDTDAICSAIGHAAFLRLTGEPEAQAARCGELTSRTAWVLEQAGAESPILLDDVRTTAGMICRRNVVQVHAQDTFLTAYQKMLQAGVRAVPVLNDTGEVIGILRYLDLLELLLPSETKGLAVRTVRVDIKKMAATLSAHTSGADMPSGEEEENLIVLVGASSQNTVEKRLQKAVAENNIGQFLVICGDRPYLHALAVNHGARALLITGGYGITPELEALAKEKGVCLLFAAQDTASCTTLIRCSRTVKNVLDEGFITVAAHEPVTLLRKRIAAHAQDLFPVIEATSGEMLGVVSKSDLIDPAKVRIALVDHNEYAQAVRGVEEAQVIEVIDHHRLAGDIVSREPIRYLNEPVGSTSTLVARKYHHRNLTPDTSVALCLLAGIVSDTLNLSSPTATELDRDMLTWLAEIAQINATEFTRKLFAVGSLLAHGDAISVINADRKAFTDEGYHISIAQVEELGLEAMEPRQAELEAALTKICEAEKLDLICLAITDISEHYSRIIAIGNPAIIAALPFTKTTSGYLHGEGIVSRKKQIFPAVCQAIRRVKL